MSGGALLGSRGRLVPAILAIKDTNNPPRTLEPAMILATHGAKVRTSAGTYSTVTRAIFVEQEAGPGILFMFHVAV